MGSGQARTASREDPLSKAQDRAGGAAASGTAAGRNPADIRVGTGDAPTFYGSPVVDVRFVITKRENKAVGIVTFEHQMAYVFVVPASWTSHVQLAPPLRCTVRNVRSVATAILAFEVASSKRPSAAAFSACSPGKARTEIKILVSRAAFTYRGNAPVPSR